MKKFIIVLMAMLCIAPVFAKKSIGLEVGGNVGYSYRQFCKAGRLMDAEVFRRNNVEGLELGANAKYALGDSVSVYAKADAVVAVSGILDYVTLGTGEIYRRGERWSSEDRYSYIGADFAVGATYDFDVKKSDFGFSAGAGASVGLTAAIADYDEDNGAQVVTAFGIELLAEANYKVTDNLVAFVDIEPSMAFSTVSSVFVNGEKQSSSSYAHICFGFSASAGVRYAF